MTARRSQIAVHTFTLVLAFAVGILVGQEFCAAEPDLPPEQQCPEQPELFTGPEFIEYCPPDQLAEPEPEPESTPPPDPPPRATEPVSEKLPKGPPPATPEERRQLLSWARDQASTLQGCPRDRGHTYRLAITIELDDARQINTVSINSSEEDLTAALDACLEERIGQWILPENLQMAQRQLFFRLTL